MCNLSFLSFDQLSLEHFGPDDFFDLFKIDSYAFGEFSELTPNNIENGITQNEAADYEPVHALDFLEVILSYILGEPFLRKKKQTLLIFLGTRIERKEIERADQVMIDGLLESQAVKSPFNPIGQHDPLHAVIRGVIRGLPHMRFLEVNPDGLRFQQKLYLPVDLNSKVAVRAAYGEFAG